MSIYKGYTSNEKEERLKASYVTISPIGPNKHGLDVVSKSVYSVVADAVEAGSTAFEIVATAHSALIGDIIRFTSGSNQGIEANVINKETNKIILGQSLPAIPTAGDTFEILRSITPTLSSTGSMSASLSFTRDGATQSVIEDTITPANNRPLPVKLIDFNGEMHLNAANLDLEVQLSHLGADADSVRIGDGTETVNVSAANELQVKDDGAIGFLTTIDMDTSALAGCVDGSELQVDVVSSALPLGAATEATLSSLNSKDFATQTTLASLNSKDFATEATLSSLNSKDFATQTTLAALLAELQLKADLTETQPVSATSWPLPTGAATEATLSSLNSKDFATQTTLAAVLTELQQKADLTDTQPVSVSSLPLPTGAATEATLTSVKDAVETIDNIVDSNKARVSVVDSLPSGNNNIGDVDIVSLPNVTLNYLDIKDTAYVNFASNNLPGSSSSPLQLIASLSADIKKIQVFDTSGCFTEIMTGSSGNEVRKFLVGPGSNETIECSIASGTRLSIRRIDSTSAATVGEFCINCLG